MLKCFWKCAALVALSAAPVLALQIPPGTELQIRLKTKVGSKLSKANDPVDADLIAPVMVGSVYAFPMGAVVHGTVVEAQTSSDAQRALLVLNFTGVDVKGAPVAVLTRVASVDNAREKVDDQGRIHGVLASDTPAGKVDAEISKVADRLGGLGSLLSGATKRVTQQIDQEITYDAGVEMSLTLTAPVTLTEPGGPGLIGKLKPVSNRDALARLAAGEPFQTVAQKPPKNSDLTNLMLIGEKEEVEQAFADAGWHLAASLNPMAKFETLEALAEDKGYNEAPVSILFLEGKPPDMVFEKNNNTFARRHHLRIWLRPDGYEGRPVWIVAATHDMGINFSAADRTFIHRIDSSIDREREKVTNDLIFAGHVVSMLSVSRPEVPQNGQNATGDNLATDGKITVLVLR